LNQAADLLRTIADTGLFAAIEQGLFADVKRSMTGGKGLAGVVNKRRDYYNPIETALRRQLSLGGE